MAIELGRRDGVAVITLNRPEALNALSFGLIGDLGRRIDEAAAWAEAGEVRALVFVGAGEKAFCAGADIPELMGRDLMAERRGARLGQTVFAKLDGFPVPSVAIVNGYAFGGGLELALACTFRVATPAARMGLPEIKLGLIPGYGGTQRLPRLIGEGRALDLILTGRTVEAEEAERIGLVTRLIEGADPLAEGIAFTTAFTRFGLPALSFARSAVTRALDLPIAQGLEIEADLTGLVFRTADAVEGMTAFVEKRKPRFRDA